MTKVGIDLGGTKTEVIVLDDALNVIERKRVSTPKNDYQEIIKTISTLISDVTKNISDFTIGVCTPGAISKKTGLIKNSNTQCLIDKPLKEDLENILGKRISMGNDANCFTIAESNMGSAKGFGLVFGVIMGTGIGGGIVFNGNLHTGPTNIAGEWGHHTLHRNGNACYCGKNGCVETYISGPSLENQWTKLTGKSLTLTEILGNIDDDVGRKWKNEFLENFGYGLANVIDILDPDVIVLGGGLSNIDFLYTEGKESVYSKVFSDSIETPILKNKLGDSAGVFGACLL
ncbi:MAG: ROK family protein [Nitrosopumilus sp.]|uniref:ROK family protein n=1 Tax=Nitrosopumilus sp. TaxID=2024843 RepID=UPI00247CE0AA|nr:ROK family protein [Nitrosopumilus sp.]MCV0392963.1 ROK family protein [Nitrosopumilus sp.]